MTVLSQRENNLQSKKKRKKLYLHICVSRIYILLLPQKIELFSILKHKYRKRWLVLLIHYQSSILLPVKIIQNKNSPDELLMGLIHVVVVISSIHFDVHRAETITKLIWWSKNIILIIPIINSTINYC